jgi:HEAT repeat protein
VSPLWLALTLAVTSVPASDAIERAIVDLRLCTTVEDAVCQSAPGRLAVWGADAVPRLMAAFPELPLAGQVLAVTALSRIEGREANQALVALAKTTSPTLRAVILNGLGGRGGKESDSTLMAALTAKEPNVRAAAAEALGRSASERDLKRVVPALARVCGDRSEQVAVSAVESLGLLGDARAVPPLLGAMASPRVSVRRAAVFAARSIRDARVIGPLIELIRDEDPVVADDAVRALTALTGKFFGSDYAVWRDYWRDAKGKLEAPAP